MDEHLVQVMSASDAAQRVGVSASGLRRLGTIYAEVHGELAREPKTEKRIWTAEIVERLGQARALVEAERCRSIKEALTALDKGIDIDLSTDLATPVQAPTPEALGVLLNEIRSLQQRLEGLERLEVRIEEMQRQLEAPRADPKRDIELAESKRMNQYLMGELERRAKLGIEAPRRPWWRWWSR